MAILLTRVRLLPAEVFARVPGGRQGGARDRLRACVDFLCLLGDPRGVAEGVEVALVERAGRLVVLAARLLLCVHATLAL